MKNGTCELCGLPDNSYTIENSGNVFKVCKLCYDGFIEKNGSDSASVSDDDLMEFADNMDISELGGGSKPETLTPEQMAKLLKADGKRRRAADVAHDVQSDEHRKTDAAVRRAVAAKVEQTLAADTEDITRELLETKASIEEETRLAEELSKIGTVSESETNKSSTDAERDKPDLKSIRAEEKRLASIENLRKAVNPKIDDDRIKITSPEVELPKDTRPKTNFDVATSEHAGAIRFLQAFKYVVHPVVYAVFAGLVVLAVATAFMITSTWQRAVIDFSAGIGAVVIGYLLVWYLKHRLEIDRRTYLLRIRQEQIAFDSMTTPCYRELKTKYPMIKALSWLFGRLSVVITVIMIIGGTIASVILSFLNVWWLLAPVMVGAVVGGVAVYYMFKFAADFISYKLDIEHNQQVIQQTLLDLLAKRK